MKQDSASFYPESQVWRKVEKNPFSIRPIMKDLCEKPRHLLNDARNQRREELLCFARAESSAGTPILWKRQLR
jgi:hypothetical protein